MSAPPRLLAIVMHGSGRYYLEPLFAAQRLPRLKALAAQGHERYFRTELPIAAGAWVTLLTGRSVSSHGVIDDIDRDARSYDGLAGRRVSSDTYREQSVQTVMSKAGLRVASVYLPMTNPPWPINGVMISGFPLPDERRPPTYPPELSDRLPPFSETKLLSLRYDSRAEIDAYLKFNLGRIETVTRDACTSGEFDIVLGCLPTPDLAHHYFWRPTHAVALEHIYAQYEDVDRVIGRLVDAVGDDTTVVVFSDHGGRLAPSRVFGVNRWLADEGYLAPKRSAFAGASAVALTNRVANWAKTQRINHAIASRVRGRVRRGVSAMTHNTAFVDWSATRAYGLDFICPIVGVEVNLRGRQSRGIVAPSDYEPLRDRLIERLDALTDPETGARIVQRVCRREAMFAGPHIDRFPDVIGVLADDYDVKGHLDVPMVGPNLGQSDYPYMGYHGYDGYFCARAAGVLPGASNELARMIDIAPTLLTLAGVEPPSFMEGQPFDFR